MSAPTAPMPLANQIKASGTITVSVPLRGMGPAPFFTDGGTTFNSGDPTATYSIVVAPAGAINDGAQGELLDLLDRLLCEGSATVA